MQRVLDVFSDLLYFIVMAATSVALGTALLIIALGIVGLYVCLKMKNP